RTQRAAVAARIFAGAGATQGWIPHRQYRPAGRRRQATDGGCGFLSQGTRRHDRRPQGRADHRGHGRQSRPREDQDPGAGRTLQGAGDDRAVGDQRGFGNRQLYSRYESAAHHHDLGSDRRSQDARGEPLGAARLRHGAAGHLPTRRLRGQDAWLQANGDRRGGFHLRPRGRRRIPARLRSGGRQDRAKTLAPAQYAGLCAVPGADQARRGRHLYGLRRQQSAAVPEAIGGLRAERENRRARKYHEHRRGILKLMGEEAVDTFSAGWYAAGLDTADNKTFVAGINAGYQHDPGFYTARPYTALLIIEEALKV